MFYGWWEYWELRHKVTFDGVNKLILVNEGETTLDVQTDIYSDWKEWAQTEDNLKYLRPLNTVGGEPTIGSERLDVTYFLINGWKIKPYTGTYDLTLVGNIFDVDGGSIKVPADVNRFNPNNISINTNTSVIVRQIAPEVTITGSGLSDSELTTLNQIDTTTQDTNTIAYVISGSVITVEQAVQGVQTTVDGIQSTVYDISGSVVAIQNLLQSPVTASLVDAQQQALFDIQDKVIQLWTLQGLDAANPLTVTLNDRTAGSITQSIVTDNTSGSENTVVTRV